MVQKLKIIEPTEQDQKFQERLVQFMTACKKIDNLWRATGHTSGSPVDDLMFALAGMGMLASSIDIRDTVNK